MTAPDYKTWRKAALINRIRYLEVCLNQETRCRVDRENGNALLQDEVANIAAELVESKATADRNMAIARKGLKMIVAANADKRALLAVVRLLCAPPPEDPMEVP